LMEWRLQRDPLSVPLMFLPFAPPSATWIAGEGLNGPTRFHCRF
jgi:hypothetical protein